MTLAIGSMLGSVSAQTGALSARSRVMHVWVDPHYGNDFLAWIHNPLPCDVADSRGQPLLHMSFPFRTVSAALHHLRIIGLPRDGSAAQWEYAIVHLLPGLYTNRIGYDPHLQLVGNSESFPIDVPARVSIQGTSALDTIIDLNGHGPAFRFGEHGYSTGDGCFISNLSIFGAPGALPPESSWGAVDTSAIAVVSTAGIPTVPRIEGCFIYGNGVGILIDAPGDFSVIHEVTVVNCTIAWNGVGLWTGDQSQLNVSGQGVATARLALLNNIFDASPPHDLGRRVVDGYPNAWNGRPFPKRWMDTELQLKGLTSRSGFEGVRVDDLHIVVNGTPQDFNAYEQGVFNRGQPYPELGLPVTAGEQIGDRSGEAQVVTGIDISGVTGGSGGVQGEGDSYLERGVLYIRDLFHNAVDPAATGNQGLYTQPGVDFDLSPGDFRLAPAVTTPHQVTVGDPNVTVRVPGVSGSLNALVDAGFSGNFPVHSESGLLLEQHPRSLWLGDDNNTWPWLDWTDFTDVDGFGNCREYDHPEYPGDSVDIGADELGELVVAGYRFGTRTFTRNQGANRFDPTGPALQVDNRCVWIVGPPDALTGRSPNTIKPCYSDNWWASPGYVSQQLTMGKFYATWEEPHPGIYYNPLVVDITPFLQPDAHPYNSVYISRAWPSNPVWSYNWYPNLTNPALYENPTWPIVNPPGVVPQARLVSPNWTVPGFTWLDNVPSAFPGHNPPGSPGYRQWAEGGVLGGAPAIRGFSDWCMNWESVAGASLEADVIGSSYDDGTGSKPDWRVGVMQLPLEFGGTARFSLEFRDSPFEGEQQSNIQTFMVWRQD